eukprot:3400473-Rhodomonas_salina.1
MCIRDRSRAPRPCSTPAATSSTTALRLTPAPACGPAGRARRRPPWSPSQCRAARMEWSCLGWA